MNRQILLPVLFTIGLFGLWEGARLWFHLPPIILPPLLDVLVAITQEPRFLTHCAITVAEALVGFLFGNLAALGLGILILRSRTFEFAIMPYAIALKTIPVVAIAPILLLWFGGGWASKAAAAAAVCFFPTLVNWVRGLRIADGRESQEYRDLFRCWDAGWWQVLIYLRVPLALPLLFSALKVSSSLALVGAIVTEFIASDIGLGFLIMVYSRRLETASMFGAVLACVVIGVAWFYVIVLLERSLSRRFGTVTSPGDLL